MAEIKLFDIEGCVAKEQQQAWFKRENELQALVEKNMDEMFGVTFLAHEYAIKGLYDHDGRMDSIGIDENGCPVIFEYKKVENENVINQGLFYLDWLLNHKNDFYKLVLDKLGVKAADNIEWSNPRVLCIAPDFNKYDEGAINLMNQDIQLVRWRLFEKGSLMFEYFKQSNKKGPSTAKASSSDNSQLTFSEKLNNTNKNIKDLFDRVDAFLLEEISDDVSANELKFYKAYKKIKNFVCIIVDKEKLLLYLNLDPTKYELENGFSRNMTGKGHLGTGDLEITIKSEKDFDKAKRFFKDAYNIE